MCGVEDGGEIVHRPLTVGSTRYNVLSVMATKLGKNTFRVPVPLVSNLAGCVNQTVRNVVDGYGPLYNEQRGGPEVPLDKKQTYTGTLCAAVVEPGVEGVPEVVLNPGFDTAKCVECSNNAGKIPCPLKKAFERKQEQERRRGNVYIALRDIKLTPIEEVIEYSPAFHEELRALVGKGEWGRFEPLADQGLSIYHKTSRSIRVKHPDYPDEEFVVAMGLAQLGDDNEIKVRLPDTTRNVRSALPNIGGVTISPRGELVSVVNNEVLGGYSRKKLLHKVEATRQAASLLRDIPWIFTPEIVSYGVYNNLIYEGDEVCYFAYSIPKGFENLDQIENRLIETKSKKLRGLELVSSILGDEEMYGRMYAFARAVRSINDKGLLHLQLHRGNWGTRKILGPKSGKVRFQVLLTDWGTAHFGQKKPELIAEDMSRALSVHLLEAHNLVRKVNDDANLNEVMDILWDVGYYLASIALEGYSLNKKEGYMPFFLNFFNMTNLTSAMFVSQPSIYKQTMKDIESSNSIESQDKEAFSGFMRLLFSGMDTSKISTIEGLNSALYNLNQTLIYMLLTHDLSGQGNKPPIEPKTRSTEVGRNDPCPCGSGKKYKQCHGRPNRGA